jgi:hypothetical protein
MVKIEFTTDNAAFDDDPAGEVARVLHELAFKINDRQWTEEESRSTQQFPLFDINGNTVGSCKIGSGTI